jgi:hypothetical protein
VAGDNKLDFIALSETNKNSFSAQCLENFCAGDDFVWHWRCPWDMSGGMLMGLNQGCFKIENIEDGDYRIKFVIKNKADGFQWALLSIYGAAQEEHRKHFLSELVRACTSYGDLPFLVGGDFNIIRNPSKKNNLRYNNKWPLLFNAIIETLNLRELELTGRKYTWANYAKVPTYEKLDRILVTTDCEQKFSLASV